MCASRENEVVYFCAVAPLASRDGKTLFASSTVIKE